MEMTKVVKPFIRRGANTFGNTVYMNVSKCELLCEKCDEDQLMFLCYIRLSFVVRSQIFGPADSRGHDRFCFSANNGLRG